MIKTAGPRDARWQSPVHSLSGGLYRPSGTAGVGAEVIGVPGANGRGGPPITVPAVSFSTNLGLHGPEIIIRAITAITTKATIIGQLILLISTSPPLNRHSNRPRQARFLLLPQCCLPTPLPSPAASLISRMKGKEGKAPEHLVPLSWAARQVIASLPRINGPAHSADAQDDSPSSQRGSSRRHGRRLGQPRFAPRRSLRSVGLRVEHNVAEAILAHRPPGIVGTYDLHEYEDEKPRRWRTGRSGSVHRQPGACRARQGRQAAGTAAMMARQIAARGRLCGTDVQTGISGVTTAAQGVPTDVRSGAQVRLRASASGYNDRLSQVIPSARRRN